MKDLRPRKAIILSIATNKLIPLLKTPMCQVNQRIMEQRMEGIMIPNMSPLKQFSQTLQSLKTPLPLSFRNVQHPSQKCPAAS